jgi:hypothetical protein
MAKNDMAEFNKRNLSEALTWVKNAPAQYLIYQLIWIKYRGFSRELLSHTVLLWFRLQRPSAPAASSRV